MDRDDPERMGRSSLSFQAHVSVYRGSGVSGKRGKGLLHGCMGAWEKRLFKSEDRSGEVKVRNTDVPVIRLFYRDEEIQGMEELV